MLSVLLAGLLTQTAPPTTAAPAGGGTLTDPGIDPSKIPGSTQLNTLVSGLRGWGLILALAAIVIAGIIWAFGAQSQNAAQATQGKRGVIIALGVAALIAAAPVFVNWAQGLGHGIQIGS